MPVRDIVPLVISNVSIVFIKTPSLSVSVSPSPSLSLLCVNVCAFEGTGSSSDVVPQVCTLGALRQGLSLTWSSQAG